MGSEDSRVEVTISSLPVGSAPWVIKPGDMFASLYHKV